MKVVIMLFHCLNLKMIFLFSENNYKILIFYYKAMNDLVLAYLTSFIM